jgi:predicted RNA-binding protein YlqC (UPF0109 family)
MTKETVISIQCVHGGFVLTTQVEDDFKTEVFTSQGKLLKALRTLIDEQSLISKKEVEDKTMD